MLFVEVTNHPAFSVTVPFSSILQVLLLTFHSLPFRDASSFFTFALETERYQWWLMETLIGRAQERENTMMAQK